MKHLSTMLLALGLITASASAQNVTVVMKDGTSQKFNADYLSEISFRDVPQGPETVVFESIVVEPYSNGNVTLTFKNADGSVECVTDLYGSKTATWLQTGVYTVSNTNDAYTMDPAYSSVTSSGSKNVITGGQVGVTLDGHVFSFAIDLTLDNGTEFKGTYTGELDTYVQWLKAELDKASYNENPQPAGNFYVKFSDPDWKYEMALVFIGNPSDTELAPGIYNYSETATPGTISPASYVDAYRPNANMRLVSGSKVTVAKEGSDYTITMDLVLDDGRTADFTYKGEITGTPSFDNPGPEVMVFDQLHVNYYGRGNSNLEFNMTGDKAICLALDCYGSSDAAYFETGIYNVGTTGLYIDPNIQYTFLAEDGENTGLSSGKMDVTRDGAVYTFDIDVNLADGRNIKATYTGTLDAFSPITVHELTVAEYNDNVRPAGNMYVKLRDNDWTCAVALDFFTDKNAKTLPAGTYVYSTENTPGTFSSKSYIETNTTYYLREGSTVTVSEADGVYTIEMSLLKDNGTEAIVTFNGEISGAPVFEPVSDVLKFESIFVDAFSGGNNTLHFFANNNEINLSLDCYSPGKVDYLETGTYTVGTFGDFRIDDSIAYTFYAEGTEITGVVSGEMNVTREGNVYTFDINVTLSDDRVVKGTYTGTLNAASPIQTYVVTNASYNDNARPAGNIYVKFNDDNWNCAVALDFFTDKDAKVLPAGTYVYSTDNTPGTFSSKSYVETNTTYYVQEGSTVTVSENGGVYTIEMTLLQDNGIENIVTFNGEITGTPIFE